MLDLKSNNRGFTLIEVMIVAFVLAVIAGISVMAYMRTIEVAQAKLCTANQKVIYEAAVLYTLSEPTSLRNIGGQKARLDELVDKGYIKNNKGFECPSSPTKDYDDYIMVFDGNNITDIQCQLDDAEHKWP